MQEAIDLYAQVVQSALPYAVAFAVGNLVVTTFLKMAFKGRIEF